MGHGGLIYLFWKRIWSNDEDEALLDCDQSCLTLRPGSNRSSVSAASGTAPSPSSEPLDDAVPVLMEMTTARAPAGRAGRAGRAGLSALTCLVESNEPVLSSSAIFDHVPDMISPESLPVTSGVETSDVPNSLTWCSNRLSVVAAASSPLPLTTAPWQLVHDGNSFFFIALGDMVSFSLLRSLVL